jgi:hypothetical protein
MHQRLATRKNHPPHLEFTQACNVRLQIHGRDFANLPDLPDVTHHAPAIATAVGQDHQNGKLPNVVSRWNVLSDGLRL